MADDKIRVSWDELSQPEVDAKVKQQEILARRRSTIRRPQMPLRYPRQVLRVPDYG